MMLAKSVLSTVVALFLGSPDLFAGDPQKNATKSSPEQSQPAQLKWKTLEAALTDAAASKKQIMIDMYTDWCGWCKKMDKEVFASAKISAYLGEKYEIVKVNGESNTPIMFKNQKTSGSGMARGFGVRGYPTIVFLDTRGDVITMLPGYVDAEKFLPVIMFVGERAYETMEWDEYLGKYTKTTTAPAKQD